MRRRLQITKLRTRTFDEGLHDFVIRRGGLEIYPRIVAREHHQAYDRGIVRSGLAELDALLGGGLAKGTSTLLAGPAGAGKSSLATHYAFSAAKEGGHACMFLFDEALPTLLERSAGLGMPLEPLLEAGRLKIQQVDPVELSAGEFGQLVRSSVRPDETSIVVIDSLNGYLNAMPSDRFLTLQLHELLMYLGQQGVSTLLVLAHQGMMGPMTTPFDASYLADAVILLRYFEAFGEIRQAISVVKKRTGKHERSIRELRMNDGITVGPPLREFQGVLSGVPDYVGNAADVSAGTRTMKEAPALEGRVLVLAPTTADAELSEVILSDAGFAHEIYRDLPALCAELAGGVAALVITEESVANGEVRSLFDALNAQPDWSDLPILFLLRTGADSPAAVRAMELLGNVTVLDRPIRVATLVSALHTALRARRRQYKLREQVQALQSSEERFGLATQATRDAIWDLDLVDGDVEQREFKRAVFGWASGQLESGEQQWTTRLHPEDRERVISSLREALEGTEPQWIQEYRFLDGDGPT